MPNFLQNDVCQNIVNGVMIGNAHFNGDYNQLSWFSRIQNSADLTRIRGDYIELGISDQLNSLQNVQTLSCTFGQNTQKMEVIVETENHTVHILFFNRIGSLDKLYLKPYFAYNNENAENPQLSLFDNPNTNGENKDVFYSISYYLFEGEIQRLIIRQPFNQDSAPIVADLSPMIRQTDEFRNSESKNNSSQSKPSGDDEEKGFGYGLKSGNEENTI